MSTEEYQAHLTAFIRDKGITRCPAACVAVSTIDLREADRHALRRHAEKLEAQRTARKLLRWNRTA